MGLALTAILFSKSFKYWNWVYLRFIFDIKMITLLYGSLFAQFQRQGHLCQNQHVFFVLPKMVLQNEATPSMDWKISIQYITFLFLDLATVKKKIAYDGDLMVLRIPSKHFKYLWPKVGRPLARLHLLPLLQKEGGMIIDLTWPK